MKISRVLVLSLVALMTQLGDCWNAQAQEKYFSASTKDALSIGNDGFLRRWTVLEPISKPNQGNTVFVDSYLNEVFAKEYFKNQMTCLPKDGDKVKAVAEIVEMPADFRRMPDPSQIKRTFKNETLVWHKIDSKTFNLKLMRFGEFHKQRLYGVIYWVVTVINCENDMENVRLSVGSNSASKWWVNGEEALLLSGDRRMVADDGMSERLNLKKGENIIRGAIINGPGMTDFCVRFVDENGKVITNGITIK
ncbi:MAG: acetylxylan esterase [Bacteroidales bacterium]|nr:acetylxylan esterase [Bacteroidales bacterium]